MISRLCLGETILNVPFFAFVFCRVSPQEMLNVLLQVEKCSLPFVIINDCAFFLFNRPHFMEYPKGRTVHPNQPRQTVPDPEPGPSLLEVSSVLRGSLSSHHNLGDLLSFSTNL